MKHAPAILAIMLLSCQYAFADPNYYSNYSSLNKDEKKQEDCYKLILKEVPRLKDIDEGLGKSFKSFFGMIGMDDFMSVSLKGAKGSMVLYGGRFITAKEFDRFAAKEERFSVRLDLKSNYSKSEVDVRFRGYGLNNFQLEAAKDYQKQGSMNVYIMYRIQLK